MSNDHIERAKVLLGGGASDRAEARSLLEEVASREQGLPAALEALEWLRLLDGERPPERKDPQVKVLEGEWLSIVYPQDGRLPEFLGKLRQTPAAWPELAHPVARAIQGWFHSATQQALKSLKGTGPEPEKERIAVMESLAAAVSEIPILESELRNDLMAFREARFRLLLSELGGEVRRACAAWQLDEVWTLMEQLAGAPQVCEEEVRRLEQGIYEADALRTRVEGALERWSADQPLSWAELRVSLEALAEARRLEDDSRVPPKWRDRLSRSRSALCSAALAFLREQAAGADTVERLREVRRNYQRLAPAGVETALEEQADWYDPALSRLEKETAQVVQSAAGARELMGLAEQLLTDLDGLSPVVSARLAEWGGQLRRIAESWQKMERGEEFTAPEALLSRPPSVLPDVFAAAAPRFQEWLEQLGRSQVALESQDNFSRHGAAVEEALRIASLVLGEVPEHQRARDIREKAQRQRTHLRLDQALSRWDVDELFGSGLLHEVGGPYQDLAGSAVVLRELAGLAAAPELRDSWDAAKWWQRWKRGVDRLVSNRPKALGQALRVVEARRSGEWSLSLDRLLRTDPSPEVCREMVSLLADFRSLPGLLGIYEELSRREKVGRVEGLLDAGHWELADEAVKEVAGWVADHRRLACRLAVLRARALGAVPFAEEVARSWADTVAAFGSQAYGLLEAAIAGAWERQETAVVRKLEEIARRVIRTADLPTGVRSPLQDWLRWLQVEQALDEGASATSLRQLSVYAREQEASAHLRTRLLRCVKRWRQRDALVALAWAFQAFPELFAVGEADPGEELAAQGLKAAGLALLEVRARADIQRVEVAELHQQIERRERDWRDLDDYLNLVPHKVARAPIPEEIFRVRDLLGSLLRAFEAVEHLESCDLRSAAAESLWNSTRLLLLQDLKDLPVTTGLLRRLDRLQPLTRMEFFELRLRDTAARCSEPEPQELDQQGLFAETAKWVRLIVERFEKAGLVAGEMWAVVSAEYWRDIPALAGDLQPPADRDLHALVQRFDALEDQEREFREALRQLDADEPWVSADGPFHPESHRRYLDFYPQTRPESRRVFRLFDRFVRVGVRPIILRDGVGSLPAWIADYLNRGVP